MIIGRYRKFNLSEKIRNRLSPFRKISLILTALSGLCTKGYTQNWLPVGEGLRCSVFDLIHDLTINPQNGDIYARGFIFFDGDCDTMRTVAHWNGSYWGRLGPPLGSVVGVAVGMYQGSVYGGGNWWGLDWNNPTDNELARWTGTSWDSVPGSPFGVGLIEEHHGDLYLGGTFNECADFSTKLITRQRNGVWEKLVPHFEDNPAYGLAMAIYQDTLYVGGQFSGSLHFGPGVNDLATVYDTSLHIVGTGLNGSSIVEAMAVYRDTLFIGGSFSAGNFDTGQHSFLITYANGGLQPYPIQPDGRVAAMKPYGDALYIAGWFRNFGDSASCHVVKLKNGQIEVLNKDTLYYEDGTPYSLTGTIRDIDIYNDTLYLAGAFYAIGADTALNCIAKLNRALGGPGSVSVSEHTSSKLSLKLYPNPVREILTVHFGQSVFNPVIHIYDLTGKSVIEKTLSGRNTSFELDVSALAPGTYFLQLSSAEGMLTSRFLKEP